MSDMDQQFVITFVGGESFTVTTSPVDFVHCEAHLGRPVSEAMGLTGVYFLAFSAARRAGKAGSDFEAWLTDVASIENPSEDADPNAPAAA